MSGRETIEQTHQNDKAECFSENKDRQEDNTKLFTLARKVVDNVLEFYSLNG